MTKRDRERARSRARALKRGQENAAKAGRPIMAPEATPDARPTKRMDGLEWLYTRSPPCLTYEQSSIGRRYGEICSEAHRVCLPGKAGAEGSGFGTRTPTQATFDAIRAKAKADALLSDPFPPEDGKALVELLERVCHAGETCRDIAGGDRYQALVIEERLKMGLSILRSLVNSSQIQKVAGVMA